MTTRIHETAVVGVMAEVGDVEIGPFAVIESNVVLGDGVTVGPHAVIHAGTRIGEGCTIGPHAVLGGAPQDLKHDPGTATHLEIGARNVFREFVTAHRGSSNGTGTTRIGDGGYFMANSHVAHDCSVGDGVMFANSAAIGGHVVVGDHAVLGGLSAVHQHCRIGRLAMLGGGAMCAQDVPPFSIAQGDRARLFGLNIIGLRRGGLSDAAITALKEGWRALFVGDLPRRIAQSNVQDKFGDVAEVAELLAFLRSSTRGICRTGVQP